MQHKRNINDTYTGRLKNGTHMHFGQAGFLVPTSYTLDVSSAVENGVHTIFWYEIRVRAFNGSDNLFDGVYGYPHAGSAPAHVTSGRIQNIPVEILTEIEEECGVAVTRLVIAA